MFVFVFLFLKSISVRLGSSLRAKQSFQSNKTLRKPSGVLTTYQGLFFRKTSKKEFKFDLGGIKKLKVLFPPDKRVKLSSVPTDHVINPNKRLDCSDCIM